MSGRLILLCGLPGAGKTTLARQLAETHGAVRLCPDEWMSDLHLDGLDAAARTRIETLQRRLAMRLVSLGQVVALEFGFWVRDERASLRDEARALGASVELRFLDAPLEELWRRVDARNHDLPWGAFAVAHDDLHLWATTQFEAPDADELATFDEPG